ncbi:MAG: hypothetical protein K2X26_08410 [Chitinophagaceae bacterium]|nr:hypothetical protein [Chitinophagaceae bacterium]
MKKAKTEIFLLVTPLCGIILFLALYVLAANLYPGGSQVDLHAVGFSWVNNYWCNLLNKYAINGEINKAQPVALTAMFILCFSLSVFWWIFPKYLQLSTAYKWVIKISGLSAMGVACFLFTNYNHDLITNLASFFGGVAVIVGFMGLYKNGWLKLFYVGLVNILLVGLNNILYYNKAWIYYLPLVQKISFLFVLSWIASISIKMYGVAKNQK